MNLLTILDKELREVVKNKLLLFTVVLPPLIFAVMPIIMLWAAQSDPMSPEELEVLYRIEPGMRGLDPVTATQVLLVSQFMFLFLIIPAVVPLTIASFSIIGEKQARSLEPLLAAPIHVWELLVGKSLAAVVPAVLATWAGYAIALVGVHILGTEIAVRAALNPVWLLSMFTLAPLLSVSAVGVAIIVSSRVNDTRVAQQANLLLVMPIVGLFIAQVGGRVLVSSSLVLLAALGLVAINAALYVVAVRLFRRETILTDWR